MNLIKKEPLPYLPTKYEDYHVMSLKALADGIATAEQQKMALAFLVNDICGTYDLSYRSSSDRDTAFCEGRRFVGLQVVKFLKLNLGKIKKGETR